LHDVNDKKGRGAQTKKEKGRNKREKEPPHLEPDDPLIHIYGTWYKTQTSEK